jgi:hypothetical protein
MSQPALTAAAAMPSAQPLSDLHTWLASIRRETHAHDINRIVNHPAVYPQIRAYTMGRIDYGPAIANPANVMLMGEHGGVLFVRHQPGVYETHTQVLPEGRGKWTLSMVRAALHWMFTRTDAVEIMTRVPRGNLGALALVRAIGGVHEFTNPRGWVQDGDPVPAAVYALRIQDWARKAPGLQERGKWFHDQLVSEYARLGVTKHEQHDDDDVHDRYVGLAAEMMMGGQPIKGAIFYNRWAVMADYQPISIVSLSPLTVDIRDAILCVRENSFWMMSCRVE